MIRQTLHREAAEDAAGSLAVLAAPAPATLRTTSSSRSAWSTGWRRSPRRSAGCGSPGTAGACPRSSRPRTGPRRPHGTRPGPGAARSSWTRSPTGWPRRSPGGSRASVGSGSPWTSAAAPSSRWRSGQGARDPARRGPAVRLDRRGDRPAEGRARRRHGPRAQPGAADRPVPPRRPDRRDHRPVQPRRARATSGRSSRPRASTRRHGGRRAARRATPGSTTTHIVCWPTCSPRAPGAGPLPGVVPVAPRGPAEGYRPCKICRPVAVEAAA